jgi:hypothetical protein
MLIAMCVTSGFPLMKVDSPTAVGILLLFNSCMAPICVAHGSEIVITGEQFHLLTFYAYTLKIQTSMLITAIV